MKTSTIISTIGVAFLLLGCESPKGGDLSRQDAILISVELGTADGKRIFKPDKLTLEAGKLYEMIILNASQENHYFSAPKFAAAVWTRKVEGGGIEVKGDITEIEVKPGGEAEWYFVPVQAGTFDLQCTIEGHAKDGMIGQIIIQ